jgi:hypothetical protein
VTFTSWRSSTMKPSSKRITSRYLTL